MQSVSMDGIAFGTDGWRGRIARELTFETAMTVVDAMGAWTRSPDNRDPGDTGTIVIVHDTRFLSPELAAEGASLLARRGFRVLLGDAPVPTPCASWHVKSEGLRAGIAITASHNPAEWNGVKYKAWFGGSAPPETYDAVSRCAGRPLPDAPGGEVVKGDLRSPYRDGLAAAFDLAAIRAAGLNVLFDAMHGAAGTLLEEIVGTGGATRVTSMRASRDPLFGGVHPEPIPPHLDAAAEEARRGSYDVVLASDGDGDRLGVLAPDGRFVTPHRILALLAESLTKRGRIAPGIVKTFSTSLLVDRVAARLGVPLHVTPIGFKYVAEKLLAGEAGIGGEESGGLGVSFFLPERDGVFTSLLLLEAIALSGTSFSALLERQDAEYGAFAYGRRDLRRPMPLLSDFVRGLAEAPPESVAGEKVTAVSNLDGVKLHFGDRGWLLHRLSGTEPLIRVYAEHEDPAAVESLLDETAKKIARL